ncbi:DUF350 domain-containing protein [Candidatus Micrarchaeota archaeon]|nr:DUF350 domain-containing protein [Candidatus Micrarchaeota archaeon]
MGIEEIIGQLGMIVAQLVIGVTAAVGSVYLGLRIFDWLTRGVEEWKELKKGNLAIGIFLGGIILSIAIILESGVRQITAAIIPNTTVQVLLIGLGVGVGNLIISVLAAILAIYIAVVILNKITIGIDEIKELKKGNVAVAAFMTGVIVAISFIIRGAVTGLAEAINIVELARLLGL